MAHRDIKPDNIVISPNFQKAILLDLGVLLLFTASEVADAGTGDQFLGTTRYSPPEYVMREEEDTELGWRAVTFYQLGAVLHDLVMRRPIFGEITGPAARLIEAVRSSRPVIDAEGVPAPLLALARNCLQKNWRLRLELVRWEHFNEAPAPTQVAEVKERIRRRLAHAGSQAYAAAVPPTRVWPTVTETIGGFGRHDRQHGSRNLPSIGSIPSDRRAAFRGRGRKPCAPPDRAVRSA
jgi:serine/threonine protein kinase